jgi:hypothetical protein
VRWFYSLSNLSKVGSEDLKFFSWCSLVSRDMLNFNTFFAVKRILHLCREQFFSKIQCCGSGSGLKLVSDPVSDPDSSPGFESGSESWIRI